MPLAASPADPPVADPVRSGGSPVVRPPGWLGARAAVDGLVCLAIAVLMLRCFEVEGYMISTGSMAPNLYGYHKRVECPRCGTAFARGVAFDDASAFADEDSGSADDRATCPNCGQTSIDLSGVPRNHGDQLLVFKPAYELRPPRRWEVAVFRNPQRPKQAFVKRVAGLPGERVQVIDGDLYADGAICRKPFDVQRAMRISVFDADREPTEGDGPRWGTGEGWAEERTDAGSIFRFAPTAGPSERADLKGSPSPGFSWLTYRHHLRSGGDHETAVVLAPVPAGFLLPHSPFVEAVRFDADPANPTVGTLTAVGALTTEWEAKLRDISADPAYQAAIDRLAAGSRNAPVTDVYGYNRKAGLTANAVRDLSGTFRLRLTGPGRFAVEMTDGREAVRLLADTAAGTLSLLRGPAADGGRGVETVRSAPLPAGLTGDGAVVELSLFDRQAAVAVDGVEPFAPWAYDEPAEFAPVTRRPVRLGAEGLTAEVRNLLLHRDVFYTAGRAKNGVAEPYALGADEYFMLGDNSPVSLDSRSWPDAAVPAKLLLGKPFLVHLPSRPGTLRLGDRRFTVRIPDPGRMRYIR